ncbi:MAG: hypothetical protein LQ340_001181 [Diploschistes diacapsis]|nr:MAG: hypothetical protein LQ340_001181 [Diploschistes diacapsis]
MHGVLPGKPRATPQAVCTSQWTQKRLIIYIAGNALVILDGPAHLVQTIYHDDVSLLDAVAIDKDTGKIAVLGQSNVYVYRPYGLEEASLKWSLQFSFTTDSNPAPSTLSWGHSEELLIASVDLRLYRTSDTCDLIWQRLLSSPARVALQSPDGSLIASIAQYDRLVKVWRRCSSGDGNVQFDYGYLAHPSIVTGISWQEKQDESHNGKHVLYTLCADSKARVWVSIDPHGLQVLQIWAEIDLLASIQPRHLDECVETKDRYVFFIDGNDFKTAVQSVQASGEQSPVLEHLVEAVQTAPDLCFGGLLDIFDPSSRKPRFISRALWTGHEGSIKKIIRTNGGRAIVSRTDGNESLVWKQSEESDAIALRRHSSFMTPNHIHRTCVLDGGDFVANLYHEYISIWDATEFASQDVASCRYELDGNPLCLILLAALDTSPSTRYIATISSSMTGLVWRAKLPQLEAANGCFHRLTASIEQFCTFDLGHHSDLAYVLPVDPAGSIPIVSGFLDTFSKDIALSYTTNGVLCTWAAKVDTEHRRVDWLATAKVITGISQPSLASGSSIRKVALVDAARNGLTIWDTSNAQLEYGKQYSAGESIQDLDWTSTPDDQSILAVGFSHKVMVLAQIRYDYLDRRPSWAPIREISIRESTPHPIGDSTWLGSGSLVIGAGSQLFVYDKFVASHEEGVKELSISKRDNAVVDLFDVVSLLNGPLPMFHPQLLSQCILAGKLPLVQKVIIGLHRGLKYFTDGDALDSSLSIPIEEFFEEPQQTSLSNSRILRVDDDDYEPDTVTEDVALSLNENLTKKSIPYLSSQEKFHLVDLIECVATAEKHRRSMDENATRFLLFFRRYMLRRSQRHNDAFGITWREIAWAFHSNSQDILADQVSHHFQGRMLWEHAKESGIFMWMTDINALRAQFEIIARNEYTKTDERNPIDCSIYYLALKKKAVLIGLWKMATWHREQSTTQKFLSNNFNEQRWQTSARKNAYALMGKRRFEYAAAFFLLAGDVRDAVNICVNQMQDIQLAIAIARVHAGDESGVLYELLEEKVLPLAAFEGNRWMASWAFWTLGRRDMAVRSLITPVNNLLDSPGAPSQEAQSYLATDPALVVLYRQLREKTLQALIGASQVSPRTEWEFVMQIARLYDRMGCDVLALDLVRNWDFLKLPPPNQRTPKPLADPRKMLRRRSSLVVTDLPSPKSPMALKTPAFKPPPSKVFEEPTANSLLDSFGF